MTAARRAARQKLATIGASALAAVGETVQCIEGMQTRGSIDAFSREGGSGSSADDEEMEWLMQTQQMLAQWSAPCMQRRAQETEVSRQARGSILAYCMQ